MKPIGLLVIGLTLSGLGAKAAEPWRFEDTIRFALTNSPDARVALQRIAAAEAGLRQANAMAWPKLQFQSSYT
ncbi:MAG: hypothetical protein NZ739_10965, partial [Verrucomicrobiae bacterium]|nr:hypothetical protein [Verrucomicrobiae bacterium]